MITGTYVYHGKASIMAGGNVVDNFQPCPVDNPVDRVGGGKTGEMEE
jgi:hypothetical protein